MTNRRSLFIFAATALLGACSQPTHYHLVSDTDSLKVLVTDAPPDGWEKVAFNDASWQSMTGTIAVQPTAQGATPTVLVRRTFDVGAEAAAYHTLTLTVQTQGSWTAFLNGTQVGQGSGATPATISTQSMQSAGDVLALSIAPAAGTTQLDVKVTLDGQADTTAAATAAVAKGPWLTSPTTSGATIVWETSAAAASQAIVDGTPYDGGSGTHHQVVVNNLKPSQAYTYHVETNGQKSEDAQLTTAPLPGQRVRFVVYGDNRTDGDAHRRVVEAIEAEGPDFLINTGDLVDTSSDTEWQDFFNIEYALIRHTPIFPTLGNHDASNSARFVELFPMNTRADQGGQVYSSDFGDVHLAAIDSNGNFGQQAKWLDQDLTQAQANGAKHLFVFLHWGPYSSGSAIQHGSNIDARNNIVPVAKAHGVDAIFAGHDHFYERGASDKLAYFVCGGGGAPLASAGQIAETVMSKSAFSYVVVDVAGGKATVTAKDLSGNPFDTVDLPLQ